MAVNVVTQLEEGVELYRRSLRRELWLYYAASAPFAGLLLWDWQAASSTRLAHAWMAALWLTLAYGWRIVGTGAYSRRLLGMQSGGETTARWALIGAGPSPACGQAPRLGERRLGGPGSPKPTLASGWLVEIWTHAVLVTMWWAALPVLVGTATFYTAAQYSPLQPEGGVRAALRGALIGAGPSAAAPRAPLRRGWGQQWGLLGIMLLAGVILLINLGITALVLPGLLHALLGVAGVMGRADTALYLASSSSFWLSLLLAVYLALDPLMKCTMTVAYYRMQAVHSGADLEAAIGRLPKTTHPERATAALLLGLCLSLGVGARAQVTAPQMQQAIRAELQQPAYAWHGNQPAAPWIGTAVKKILRPLGRGLEWIAGWLRRWLEGAPAPARSGGHSLDTRRAAWALIGLCLLLGMGLLLTQRRRWRRRPPATVAPTAARPRLNVATASAAEQEDEAWFALARELQRAGELRLALRAAFLGGLAGLGKRRLILLRRDRTNAEYAEELRRAPLPLEAGAELAARFRRQARRFEEVWYGGRAVGPEQVEAFLGSVVTGEW